MSVCGTGEIVSL